MREKMKKFLLTTVVLVILLSEAVWAADPVFTATGIITGKFGNEYRVTAVIKGSPAYEKVLPGDVIASVNGSFTGQWTPQEVVDMLQGRKGETTKIILKRGKEDVAANIMAAQFTLTKDSVAGSASYEQCLNQLMSARGYKILSIASGNRFSSREITERNGYPTGSVFDLFHNGIKIGSARMVEVHKDKSFFLLLEGKPLTDKGYTQYRLVYSCYKPLQFGDITEVADEMDNTEVLNSGLTCEICGCAVKKGIVVENVRHCNKCFRKYCDRCWVCGENFSKEKGMKIYHNTFICEYCMTHPVDSVSNFQALNNKVVEILEKELGMHMRGGSANLEQFNLKDSTLGYARAIKTYSGRRLSSKIAAAEELPFLALLGTLAHENAHVWQIKVNPGISDLTVIEGFAKWVEYKFYQEIGCEDFGKWMLENSPPLYQNGYRLFENYEQRYGAEGVLRLIKSGR